MTSNDDSNYVGSSALVPPRSARPKRNIVAPNKFADYYDADKALSDDDDDLAAGTAATPLTGVKRPRDGGGASEQVSAGLLPDKEMLSSNGICLAATAEPSTHGQAAQRDAESTELAGCAPCLPLRSHREAKRACVLQGASAAEGFADVAEQRTDAATPAESSVVEGLVANAAPVISGARLGAQHATLGCGPSTGAAVSGAPVRSRESTSSASTAVARAAVGNVGVSIAQGAGVEVSSLVGVAAPQPASSSVATEAPDAPSGGASTSPTSSFAPSASAAAPAASSSSPADAAAPAPRSYLGYHAKSLEAADAAIAALPAVASRMPFPSYSLRQRLAEFKYPGPVGSARYAAARRDYIASGEAGDEAWRSMMAGMTGSKYGLTTPASACSAAGTNAVGSPSSSSSPSSSAPASAGDAKISTKDHAAIFDGFYQLKVEQRRICGTGTPEAYLLTAQAILGLTGEITRTKAKDLYHLTDADLKALDGDAAAADSAAKLKKALKQWVADNCGWTTKARLDAAFQYCSDEQLRAVLEAAPEVPLKIIARKPSCFASDLGERLVAGTATIQELRDIVTEIEYGSDETREIASYAEKASRKPSKIVHYDMDDLKAACLRKYGSAEGFAAKLAANEKAAEKRAETMALKGTSAGRGRKMQADDGFGSFGSFSGGAGAGKGTGKGRKQLDNPNPDGLSEWDDYLEC